MIARDYIWFLRNGLPSFVPLRWRLSGLWWRTAPFLAFCYTLILVVSLVTAALVIAIPMIVDTGDWSTLFPAPAWAEGSEELGYLLDLVISVGIILLFLVVAAIPAAVIRWANEKGRAGRIVGSIVTMTLGLIVLPLLASAVVGRDAAWVLAANLIIAAVAWVFSALGVGSILAWSFRQSVAEVRTMSILMGRALPVLMIVIVFAFFDNAFWQVTTEITGIRLGFVGVIFLLMGMVVALPIGRRQMRALEEDEALAQHKRLSRGERANLNAILVLAMFFQIVIFTSLTAVFLVILGEVAFTPELISRWSGKDPAGARFLGLPLSVDSALLKTALFLSFIASLNFLVSVATVKAYRKAFYGPIIERMTRALGLRQQRFEKSLT